MQQRTISMHKTSLGSGDVLNGRYVIENIIDRGGMGIIMGARHLRLDERVAIKILLPESSEKASFVARFLREGQMIAQIKSDFVVRVLDFDVTPTGLPFLVMEWLDGQDLKSFCRSRNTEAVEIGFAVRCVVDACAGLDAAHARGIVHRDIKPSNLFLSRGPRGNVRVKLIDFGISKQEQAAYDERTKTGMMLGTSAYMAPEQIRSAHRVDARADIWSLGVTLYKLITGQTPFQAKEPIATYALVLGAVPVPPRTLRPDIPEALEAIILKCLEKEPANRFESARELANALAPFLQDEEKTVLLRPSPVSLHSPAPLASLPSSEPLTPLALSPPAPTSQRTILSKQPIHDKLHRGHAWGWLGGLSVTAIIVALLGTLNRAEATVLYAKRITQVWKAPAGNISAATVAKAVVTTDASTKPVLVPLPSSTTPNRAIAMPSVAQTPKPLPIKTDAKPVPVVETNASDIEPPRANTSEKREPSKKEPYPF